MIEYVERCFGRNQNEPVLSQKQSDLSDENIENDRSEEI